MQGMISQLDNEQIGVKNINNDATNPPLPPEIKPEVRPPLHSPNNEVQMDENSNKTSDIPVIPYRHTLKRVCRDFLRGYCSRLVCKFQHKRDITQRDLCGVYVFCRDFQNKVCLRERCKYVHATLYEQQQYYKTCYLPQHALVHMYNYYYNNCVPYPPLLMGRGPSPPDDIQPADIFKIPPPPPPRNESNASRKRQANNNEDQLDSKIKKSYQ